MEDQEYPEYLKKQSYEDLLQISCTIDQTRRAERYAMVMAEIDRRDKSGEGKDTPNDPTKRFGKPFAIAFGIICALLGLFEIHTGLASIKGSHSIAESQDPVGFWMLVAFKFIMAIVCIAIGVFGDKK